MVDQSIEKVNNELLKVLEELVEHTLNCEYQLDVFHGLQNDAGSGCSIFVCNAMKAIAAVKKDSK